MVYISWCREVWAGIYCPSLALYISVYRCWRRAPIDLQTYISLAHTRTKPTLRWKWYWEWVRHSRSSSLIQPIPNSHLCYIGATVFRLPPYSNRQWRQIIAVTIIVFVFVAFRLSSSSTQQSRREKRGNQNTEYISMLFLFYSGNSLRCFLVFILNKIFFKMISRRPELTEEMNSVNLL